MAEPVKCACPSCFCMVAAGSGIERGGKIYCGETCAYECTETTCVCVHDRCDDEE
ncbi:MAG: metallothionein [Planctomycetota bacterium]|nr:metallothionein [Planctomycetota bacterium]